MSLASARSPPSASPRRDERLRDFTKQWLDQLGQARLRPADQDGKVDYLLLKNHLAHELRQLDIRGQGAAESAPLVPFARTILELDAARRELKPMDWSKVAGDLTSLTKQIGEARRSARARVRRGKDQVEARGREPGTGRRPKSLRSDAPRLVRLLRRLRPAFTWWMQEPYKAVDQALAGLRRLAPPATRCRHDWSGRRLRAEGRRRRRGARGRGAGGGGRRRRTQWEVAGKAAGQRRTGAPPTASRGAEIVGNPIGREALSGELQYEMIAYTPEELIELARKRARLVRRRDEEGRARWATATTGRRRSSTSRRCTSSPASSRR